MNAAPSAAGRDPGPRWGVALFVAWGLLAVSGFWNLVAVPMRAAAAAALDPEQAAVVERWARSVGGARAGAARVLFDPQACACGSGTRDAVLARLLEQGADALPLGDGVARLPLRPELVVLDRADRLRYAGPAAPTVFCSGPLHAAARSLSMPADAPALILPADCPCDAGRGAATDGAG